MNAEPCAFVEVSLPSEQALLAATLALMTAYAEPAAEARVDAATQRSLMAGRIVAHLAVLGRHPALGTAMQQAMGTMHRHWQALAGAAPAAAAALH